MANVGLIDVDNTGFPNLALMKLAAHYKRQGDIVDMLTVDDVLKGQSLFTDYIKIIGACVYDKPNAPKQTRWLQRWVNNKRIFRTVDCFANYKDKRSV